jgi:hypothetical protein
MLIVPTLKVVAVGWLVWTSAPEHHQGFLLAQVRPLPQNRHNEVIERKLNKFRRLLAETEQERKVLEGAAWRFQ